MLSTRVVVISALITAALSQMTEVAKKNPLLSRKKRYLAFPMKSNFGISMAYVKALMMVQPRGWNALGECDFPFALPSDTRLYKKLRRSHHIQKRELLTGLEAAFTQGGFNGSACVNKMICDAQQYVDIRGKSLVRDVLSAIFTPLEIDLGEKYGHVCEEESFVSCGVPFLSYILSSLFAG